MIDFTLFWFTLALLLVGVVYACLCTHAGRDEDDEATKSNVVRFAPQRPRKAGRQGRQGRQA